MWAPSPEPDGCPHLRPRPQGLGKDGIIGAIWLEPSPETVPSAPESTTAVDTVHEGQSTSGMDTKKSLAGSDEEGIFTHSPGGGR